MAMACYSCRVSRGWVGDGDGDGDGGLVDYGRRDRYPDIHVILITRSRSSSSSSPSLPCAVLHYPRLHYLIQTSKDLAKDITTLDQPEREENRNACDIHFTAATGVFFEAGVESHRAGLE
jgi:hypothetical protein